MRALCDYIQGEQCNRLLAHDDEIARLKAKIEGLKEVNHDLLEACSPTCPVVLAEVERLTEENDNHHKIFRHLREGYRAGVAANKRMLAEIKAECGIE